MFEIPHIFYRVISARMDKPADYIRTFESDWDALDYVAQAKNQSKYAVKCIVSQIDGRVIIDKTVLVEKESRRK